jgi:hypothetical protein
LKLNDIPYDTHWKVKNQGQLLQEEFEDTKGVIKIEEGQTTQWAKKNGQTAIDTRINRKLKIE